MNKIYLESVYGIMAAVEADTSVKPLLSLLDRILSSQDCKAGVIFL